MESLWQSHRSRHHLKHNYSSLRVSAALESHHPSETDIASYPVFEFERTRPLGAPAGPLLLAAVASEHDQAWVPMGLQPWLQYQEE